MKYQINYVIVLLIVTGGLVLGCSNTEDSAYSPGNGDGDTDGDTDADSDSDADADYEVGIYLDVDADSNSDTDSANPEEPISTNPFVYTDHDPFSTFAADVDTASYDIFRQYITAGTLLEPEKVRLEEFVNYFKYEYPIPEANGEHPFSLSLKSAPGIFNQQTNILRVGIQGKVPLESEKKPANIVFLVDTSGSMSSGDKLTLVKQVLNGTIHILDPGDTISIVTYAGSTAVHLEPTTASEVTTIENAINTMSASGSTAGASGIELAYQQAEAGFIEDGINHVVLCTDGDFNVGISSTDELVDLIEEKRETGITLAVLGFGMNSNDQMMEALSNAGNGVYGVISSAEQADDYVENRMLSNLVFIAKDMKIQVEFNPDYVLAYRLLGYENRAIADEDFTDDTVDAGEVGAGHRVTALYEVIMSDGTIPEFEDAPSPLSGDPVEGDREVAPEDMVLVKIRYKNPDATTEDPAYELRQSMSPDEIQQSLVTQDNDFQWAVAIAAFAEILKGSPYATTTDAMTTIENIITAETWTDPDRTEFVSLFNAAKPLIIQ